MDFTVEDCLPPELSGPGTSFTRISGGLSGAGVFRVEAGGRAYVLKIAGSGELEARWTHAVAAQRVAAEAGVAPAIVHVDEGRRSVLTELVEDRSFVRYYRDPRRHAAALADLGRLVRRIHALPIPAGTPPLDPHEFLLRVRGLGTEWPLPRFTGEAVERVLAEEPPAPEGVPVLGHNDLNPGNILYDGQALWVLDWAMAGPAERNYDLATLALFLRMDDATCLALLSAYHDRAVTEICPRLRYSRRFIAALAGMVGLHLARDLDHPGASGRETLDSTLSLAGFFQEMMAGRLRLGTPDGQWAFGLALLKESLAP